MTEREAQAQGLSFTGIYNSFKEETKKRIAQERIKKPGARIVLVRTPVNKLSRSYSPGACGWSAYGDKKYSAYETLEHLGDVEARHKSRMTELKRVYDRDCNEETLRYENDLKAEQNAKAILAE